MKGIFHLSPTKPRYNEVWDVSIVLEHLSALYPLSALNLKELTFKLVMLIALVSAQRAQTIALLSLDNMVAGKNSYTFTLTQHVKQSSPFIKNPVVKLTQYRHDKSLDVVATLQEYIRRTGEYRQEEKTLFLSFQKPYCAVHKETISRWLKTILHEAGIDVSVFKGHSTRAAATSKAKRNFGQIDDILQTAGWKNSTIFGKYYNKPLDNSASFAESVLNS